ncbi:hypothetical protein HDU77_007330 [Chytriomyces hyalinus]|nr:hypothetical protein HDU77_007330 [Chytriomyces hyalinus]
METLPINLQRNILSYIPLRTLFGVLIHVSQQQRANCVNLLLSRSQCLELTVSTNLASSKSTTITLPVKAKPSFSDRTKKMIAFAWGSERPEDTEEDWDDWDEEDTPIGSHHAPFLRFYNGIHLKKLVLITNEPKRCDQVEMDLRHGGWEECDCTTSITLLSQPLAKSSTTPAVIAFDAQEAFYGRPPETVWIHGVPRPLSVRAVHRNLDVDVYLEPLSGVLSVKMDAVKLSNDVEDLGGTLKEVRLPQSALADACLLQFSGHVGDGGQVNVPSVVKPQSLYGDWRAPVDEFGNDDHESYSYYSNDDSECEYWSD